MQKHQIEVLHDHPANALHEPPRRWHGIWPRAGNHRHASQRAQLEVDFICNKGSKRSYVQSALSLLTEQKWEQEQRSLLKIEDGFKKIIITKDGLAPHYNDVGILVMNVYDFLLDPRSLEF